VCQTAIKGDLDEQNHTEIFKAIEKPSIDLQQVVVKIVTIF